MFATRDDDACTTHTAGLGWRVEHEEVEAKIKDRGVRIREQRSRGCQCGKGLWEGRQIRQSNRLEKNNGRKSKVRRRVAHKNLLNKTACI